ncbi:MAG: hypothetical protein ACREID_01750, partial [Planctomycetota bacterium]
MSARSRLRALERLAAEYGGLGERKRELLASLASARLPGARDVERLHELLCLMRAYPDHAALLALVERMAIRFASRADLRRRRARLAGTGIAGTPLVFPFFAGIAAWLARRWPLRVRVAWGSFENEEKLEALLPQLALYAETPALDELAHSAREWVARMKSPGETDAAFLLRRFRDLPLDAVSRDRLYDELDLPLSVEAGPGTPSRTRAKFPVRSIAYQAAPLRRGRPDLGEAARIPPRAVRAVPPGEAAVWIDLALEAMATRSRGLDAFEYADPRDVRAVDCGEGLQFLCMGMIPERRLFFESVYGALTVKNGVPIGYVLLSSLLRSTEVAYNVFESFRGAEAGWVYG